MRPREVWGRVATTVIWILAIVPLFAALPIALVFTFLILMFGRDDPATTIWQYAAVSMMPAALFVTLVFVGVTALVCWRKPAPELKVLGLVLVAIEVGGVTWTAVDIARPHWAKSTARPAARQLPSGLPPAR